MDFWLFVLLGGAVVFLWRRVDRLEAELRTLRDDEAPRGAIPATARSATASPARPAVGHGQEPEAISRAAAATAAPIQPEPLAAGSAADFAAGGPRFSLKFDFEDLFGRLLPIWAGGIALAVAGFFLVRWSIEAGLLTVSVRVALGFLFGLALLASAEAAFRMERRVADPRVRQALAGAGLATLYASFYLAGSFYGLVGAMVAFLGLASVTAAAIALSFRFGLPAAMLGLIGGFAAPALAGGEEANLPVLTLYLALVAAGLTFTGSRQDRAWLGVASLAGGLGWGALLVLTGADSGAALVALGAYLVILGAVLPAFTGGGRPATWVRIAAAAIASVQLAALVHQGGYGALEWGLYLLLGGALAWFGWRLAAMREANAVAAAVAVFLLGFWPAPAPLAFLPVAIAVAALFAGVPLAQLWRTEWRKLDVAQACGVALGLAVTVYLQFGDFAAGRSEPLLGLVTLALAGLPALAAWMAWPARGRASADSALAAVACAAALAGTAGLIVTPAWIAPIVGALVTGGLLALGRASGEAGLVWIARGAGLAALVLLFALPQTAELAAVELARMIGYGLSEPAFDGRGVLRWSAAALALLALVRLDTDHGWNAIEQVLCALAAYGAAAQVLPPAALPWAVALGGLALARYAPGRAAASAALLALAAAWGLLSLGEWAIAGLAALAGSAPGPGEWPSVRDALLRLAPLGVLGAGALALALRSGRAPPRGAWLVAGGLALVVLHTLYRHAFAAVAGADFAATGMAQRTVWEGALLIAALAAGRLVGRPEARTLLVAGLSAAAMAHFVWFTLGVHNPLWSGQAVGPLPLANWLIPAYAAGIGALLVLRRTLLQPQPQPQPQSEPQFQSRSRATLGWLGDAALMLFILALAISELRQLFSGSLLSTLPMSQAEDLLRSLVGIVAAIGFLLWGSRSGTRSWRIGSLVLMLLAVLKVFLFDTAGLEGLARIASFMALGFSLIGIGWFYTRQLKAPSARPA